MDQVQKDRLIEEKKQRDFMDILAKASAPTNLDAASLREEVLAIGISEAGTLRGLVEHIFNQATEDVATQQTMAEFCQLMPQTFDPPEKTEEAKGPGSRSSSEKRVDFRLMVIKKCKDELDKGSHAHKAVRSWEEKEAKAKLKGEDKQQADIDRAAYARMLRCIPFCGCLYTSGVLTDKVIQACIDHLLKADEDPRSESVEVLTKLMSKVGGKFEGSAKTTKDKKTITKYFDTMEKIKNDAVSKDIAKMLNKVLTLRENNWAVTA